MFFKKNIHHFMFPLLVFLHIFLLLSKDFISILYFYSTHLIIIISFFYIIFILSKRISSDNLTVFLLGLISIKFFMYLMITFIIYKLFNTNITYYFKHFFISYFLSMFYFFIILIHFLKNKSK